MFSPWIELIAVGMSGLAVAMIAAGTDRLRFGPELAPGRLLTRVGGCTVGAAGV